ncbi:tyrosine beta-hydroxylase [Rheinheimera sp. SA_1]|uniref:MBL fold metallo-hydrolase n=1 Tax=Rheinheimera sp. SA_1 TaxID=1827365 RepID=UPI0008014BC8|nr:MBL fold metallo-hydrolase [Rheinheimera sp. SA_1]OBP13491.1 tyrosine beta-hydroxylase [Rheinheimera sp. SA_1]
MSEKLFYLKEDAYFEPLFNQWYAWSYLLPPVTGARYIVNTHKRIMMSFVNNYELHISAAKEAVVTGGEFLNCSAEQVEDIQRLLTKIDTDCAELVQLSKAINQLDELLAQHTSGQTIEALYAQVPSELSGYVELCMDLQHRPSYRLIEPLLYKSRFYRPQLQSLSFGLISRVHDRPFVLSTPRLPDENHLQIGIDYNNAFVDQLCRAREIPLKEAEIQALFHGLNTQGGLDYRELFSDTAPAVPYQPVNTGVRLQYTGHAGFLIESQHVAILIDPVIASRGPQYAGDTFSFSELPPKIDYILLTHNHQDHVNLETLLQLRYKTGKIIVPKNNGGTLADPSIRLLLKQLQFDVIEVDELDEIPLPAGKITSIPFLGEHGDLNVRSKTAWLIELAGKKCFFGADSANPDINLYRHMADVLADIDIYAIGMECVGAPYTWLYGALHSKMVPKAIKDSRRLDGSDCQQAFCVVAILKPKAVCIYALGLEPWFKYFMGLEYEENSKQLLESNRMIEVCREIGIPAERMNGRRIFQL